MDQLHRARPTIRCLTSDLALELPGLDVDLGEIDQPLLAEVQRLGPTSPRGQKRIRSIAHPMVYRVRVSTERGATWADETHAIVWLCAARRREEGSEEDAFAWFGELHVRGNLFPTEDDYLRNRAEAAVRLQRGLTADLIQLVDEALAKPGTERRRDLGNWLPC